MKTGMSGAAKAAFGMTVVWALLQGPAEAQNTIPLCPGLTIVTAVSQTLGDYESIKTIQTVSPAEVRLKYSAETKDTDIFSSGPPRLKTMKVGRTVLVKDLQSATDYQQIFLENSDERIPGTTSIGTSAAVLQDLKTKGRSRFGFSNAFAGLTISSDKKKYPNYYSYLQRGVIARVAGPATMPVIVNDVVTNLPVVRAQGNLVGDKVEFTFLDDPANPIALAFRLGIGAVKPLTPEQVQYCAAVAKATGGSGGVPSLHCDKPDGGDRQGLRVVKIAYRCQASAAAGGSGLETALANKQKVDIYSIYFSFNSDALRDESTPTLDEIAAIMTRHPEWKLALSGHTDGIGGDQYNLDLSQKRAAAVVQALVTKYHIAPARLKSAGYGKSQPKDTNDTLEGRARNRRVELMRF